MRRSSLIFFGCDLPYKSADGLSVRAAVNQVVDGDTLWVEADSGYRAGPTLIELRLVGPDFRGFNADERFTPNGRLATIAVAQYCHLAEWVYVRSVEDTEKFGRWLTIVSRPDWSSDLASILVTSIPGCVWKEYPK